MANIASPYGREPRNRHEKLVIQALVNLKKQADYYLGVASTQLTKDRQISEEGLLSVRYTRNLPRIQSYAGLKLIRYKAPLLREKKVASCMRTL